MITLSLSAISLNLIQFSLFLFHRYSNGKYQSTERTNLMNDTTVTNGYTPTKFEQLNQDTTKNSSGTVMNDNSSIASSINSTTENTVDTMDDIETMLANLSSQLDLMLTQGKN